MFSKNSIKPLLLRKISSELTLSDISCNTWF